MAHAENISARKGKLLLSVTNMYIPDILYKHGTNYWNYEYCVLT